MKGADDLTGKEHPLKLSFHGADQGVTGSCHMVECAGKRILVDCGLYQGGHELDEENSQPFGFDPASIDYVLLTHAHLDHCGRLPLLAKRGFHGEIITTAPSQELARLVMLDAAHLQEEDARYRARIAERGSSTGQPIAPLYSALDALNSFDHFGRTAVYDELIEVADGFGQYLSAADRRVAANHRAILRRPWQLWRPFAARSGKAAGRSQRGYGNHIRRPVAQALGTVRRGIL